MLPANFLRQLIGLYGNNMQTMVPQYLEQALASFGKNQEAFKDAFGTNLFSDLAKRQMALFEQGAKAFAGSPGAPGQTGGNRDDEVAKLKAELDALRAKVDRLGR
jgi:polyhydroxyalkanoate synthesis regulator protein